MEDNLSRTVDTAAAAQFDSSLGDLARRAANNPGRPRYVEASFFHRFENEIGSLAAASFTSFQTRATQLPVTSTGASGPGRRS